MLNNEESILEDDHKRKDEENKIPMHRIGEPNEIVKVALFLASDAELYHGYNNLCGWRTDISIVIHLFHSVTTDYMIVACTKHCASLLFKKKCT